MFDILSIGDATLDTFVRIEDATVTCSLEKEQCLLCLNYADKIPITRLDRVIGGNAANSAIGFSRLNFDSAIYNIVGGDDIGKQVLKTFKNEKVSLKFVKIDKKSKSNYSVVLNFKGERTILIHHEPRKYSILHGIEATRFMYLTSLGRDFSEYFKKLAEVVKKHHIFLGYNPGTFQLRAGVAKMKEILKVANVLLVNKEEAILLAEKRRKIQHPHEITSVQRLKNLFKILHSYGPEIIVITDGPVGSYVSDGKNAYEIGIFDVPIVERTGAGDSYSTGFLAALMNEKNISEAMRWGTANAASVIGKIGPQAGLLNAKGMDKMLKRFKTVQATTF